MRTEGSTIDQFTLKRGEEALAQRVVISAAYAIDTHLTHQTCHALLTYSDAYVHQVSPDSGGTIRAIWSGMKGFDMLLQVCINLCSFGW